MVWLRHKWTWARENSFFWANLLLVVITCLLIFLWPNPKPGSDPSDIWLRTWGMLLQLLGVFTVWYDLTSTARKFGKGGFMRRTWLWLKAFSGRSTGIATASTVLNVIGGTGRIKVRWPIQPEALLPDRVAALEANIEQIDKDLDNTCREIDKRTDALGAKIVSERQARDRAIQEVNTSLMDTVTGNFTALAFGAAWLAIGIVVATWSPEIVRITGWLN